MEIRSGKLSERRWVLRMGCEDESVAGLCYVIPKSAEGALYLNW
jgi:hypothetical protein